jgi:hypothetical protein
MSLPARSTGGEAGRPRPTAPTSTPARDVFPDSWGRVLRDAASILRTGVLRRLRVPLRDGRRR